MKNTVYPLSAIVGQTAAKRALLIALVNPRAGGLLLSGAQGTAKTLLVRAAGALPQVGKLTQLPLGATDDMVFGGTDIERLLADGVRTAQPGILRRAAGGLLLLDEANLLLRPFLHAALAAAEEDASVVLVGTMNPAEGTLPAAALDGFGMFVSLSGADDAAERREIVRRACAYSRAPEAFAADYCAAEEELGASVAAARERLADVAVSAAMRTLAAEFVVRARCAGNRAELFLTETARAAAALAGRTYLLPADMEEAALYVLPHRMSAPPEMPAPPQSAEENEGDGADGDTQDADDTAQEEQGQDASQGDHPEVGDAAGDDSRADESPSEERTEESADEGGGDLGDAEPPQNPVGGGTDAIFDALVQMTMPLLDFTRERRAVGAGSGKRLTAASTAGGRMVRDAAARAREHDIALAATVRAAAPYQRLRRSVADGRRIVIARSDLRRAVRERKRGANILFVVDASGSMAARARMRAVKGAILALLREAYVRRDRVGLVAFRRDRAETLLPLTRSVELAQRSLRELPTGGRTPLAAGLTEALLHLAGAARRGELAETLLVLLTDGRATAAPEGEDPAQAALMAAETIGNTGVRALVLDTEQDFVRLHLAAQVAARLHAPCYTLEELSVQRILHLVKGVTRDFGA
ncbi:MAG: VWA domain-containing protein [Selenomonas artemidis]